MSEHDEREDVLIEHIARVLRAAEPTAPAFTERVMLSARAHAQKGIALPAVRSDAWGWWRRRHTVQFSLSPLRALGMAAGLAMFAVIADITLRHINVSGDRTNTARTVASGSTASPDTVHLVRFVFMAPQASSVAMVGDFNNWDRSVTPLRRSGGGTWTVSVPLPSGPHQYAFIVDSSVWTPDPASTTTVSDDFGTLTSVIAVGGTS
jgi:hypothetical protein